MKEELREQTRRWLSEGDYDLRTARLTTEGGAYKTAALLAQQAAEKYLKGLYLAVKESAPPKTHDLLALVGDLETPNSVTEAAWSLTPEYLVMRYPDAPGFVSHEEYDSEIAERRLTEAAAIVAWVRQELERHGHREDA